MDFDRTSLDDRTLALRSRTQKVQQQLEQPTEDPTPPSRPEHGGATAAERTAAEAELDEFTERRRRLARSVLADFVRMPGDSELDIEVDVREHRVTFVIKDKRTGEVLREVPEGEANGLMEQLREFHGVLVDRSL
ncbi:MAG: flagellar protein FlaG [Planctomycetota bacterium]